MAKIFVAATLTHNDLPRLRGLVRQRAGQAVRKAASDIEAGAKDRAPVDTGALKNSIQAKSTGELSAEIGPGVDYGIYVELGTHKAAAQPYLVPAAEFVRPSFEAAMKQLLD